MFKISRLRHLALVSGGFVKTYVDNRVILC